ncbi:hypothetical protein [Niveispirillum sp.]|uniref:hypothetical protein n=1 Tax=Niveispirillum sp. TaxID=1917217 RepID=UPI001B6E689C|nr:hypothetical protein [Niveispirillum sp.]MBP7334978.1 hypothetical protein [Niveispirillum sp.]
MTASSNRHRLGGLTALALVLLAPAVLAQQSPAPTGAPLSLFPPPQATQPMAEPAPDQPVGEELAAPPATGDARSPRGVMVEELKAQDPELAGTLGPDNGGLPADLWHGLPRADVEALVAGIPAGLTSPALRAAASSLLLTSADGLGSGEKTRNFAALRAEALLRIGNADGADALRNVAPAVLEDEGAALAWLEMQFFAGNRQAACDQAPGLLSRFQHPVWQKWQIVCQVANGQTDAVYLSLDLMREQGDKDDLFARLAEGVVAGNKTPVKGVLEPTATQLALILVSGRPFPPETKLAGPGPLAALARLTSLPLPQRLAAAERALALGGLDGAGLLSIYESVPDADAKLLTVATAKKPTALLRAQVLKALRAEPTPAAKAGLFKVAMLASSTEQQAGAYGALLLEEARQFRLTVGFASIAPLVARLHLLQGEKTAALPWINLARDDFNASKDEGAFARLWPLAAAHDLVRETDFDRARWIRDLGGESARDTADGVLILLTALHGGKDAPLPPLADGSAPAGQVKGAVLLDAVNAMGKDGPIGTPALDLSEILINLSRAGLPEQARRIGAEAIAGLLRPGA